MYNDDEYKLFSGLWIQIDWSSDGVVKAPDEYGDHSYVNFSGNYFEVFKVKGEVLLKGSFVLIPDSNPKGVNWQDDIGDDAGLVLLSAYSIDSNRLMFSVADPGMKRPTDFEPRLGHTVREFRKVC